MSTTVDLFKMLLVTLILVSAGFTNFGGYNYKVSGAAIDVHRSRDAPGESAVFNNSEIKDLDYIEEKTIDDSVNSRKVVTPNYGFYQVAEISLPESFREISTFHGFVSNPPSRAKLCQLRVNKNCGFITYEPQSVEGSQGFPNKTYSPPDGKIASANNPNFPNLDEYGSNRWTHVEFPEVSCYNETHVYFNLTWYVTAPHSSKNIEIYISNEKYTSTEPLSRHHLDLSPIFTMDFYGQFPPVQLNLLCPISLEKYHQLYQYKELLLLSVWNIQDTSSAFYQVVDFQKISDISFKNTWSKCHH